MGIYVSEHSNHSLIDFSKLVLKAHKGANHLYIHSFSTPYYKLGEKEEYVFTNRPSLLSSHLGNHGYHKQALPLMTLLNVFQDMVNKKAHSSYKVNDALLLLKNKVTEKYYSGCLGSILRFLNDRFGWQHQDFKQVIQKINSLSSQIATLPQKPKKDLKKKPIQQLLDLSKAALVFTSNLKDTTAIGTLGDFTYRNYQIEWMSPGEYLARVDPYFKRHKDEESMPWIAMEMQKRLDGDASGPKFAPLMMNTKVKWHIVENYYFLDHEGRHRALTAKRLGIPMVPVAILN